MMTRTACIVPLLTMTFGTLRTAAVLARATDATLVSTGLRNLGNTCYMNAQLVCAFHIPLIRDIIIHGQPKEQKQQQQNKNKNVGVTALRCLFKDMELSAQSDQGGYPAAPLSLCRTLGIPVREQQDSQEFWKLLLPALKLDQLTELYQGAYEDYIKATDDSGRERRRDEPFLDLSLEVQSHDSILESIGDRFGAPELLNEAEGNGWRPEKGEDKIDAFKGSLLRVSGLPSLLQLHLKRFQYDWEQEEMSKLNSRCTFPAELDLKEFCSGTTEVEHEGALYDLQSVIVHVGEYASGHYYAYVRPDVREDVWYRFDDDRVTPVSLEDVVKDAYGGKTVGEVKQQEKKGLLQRLFSGGGSYGWGGPDSSAYMLQYVKRIDIKRLYDV